MTNISYQKLEDEGEEWKHCTNRWSHFQVENAQKTMETSMKNMPTMFY